MMRGRPFIPGNTQSPRRHFLCMLLMVIGFLLCASVASAQTRELGLMLGRISGPTRSLPNGTLDLSTGLALQANYGQRFATTGRFTWAGEFHFLANGQRKISSLNQTVTRDIATAFFTPGIRLKYLAAEHFTPYATVGAGYALYEQSLFQIDGAANPAPRFTHRGAFQYGAGADFPIKRWIGARVEVRDFYTGNPSFNVPTSGKGQHNLVFSGGFVLYFGTR